MARNPSRAPSLDPLLILQKFESRGISVRAVAARLHVNNGHLSRVLHGTRRGSLALLESAAELAETMEPEVHRRQDDINRLIAAAIHIFFLTRGDFENQLCGRMAQRRAEQKRALFENQNHRQDP